MLTNHQKNLATLMHLSTFCRFIIPFGNFIGPVVLWITNKEKSEFVDNHGKQAINFQISILLYTILLGFLFIPFFIFKIFNHIDLFELNAFEGIHINLSEPSPLFILGGSLGFIAVIGFILELIFIINASIKAKDGQMYQYPLSIHFLK
ncbi:MULTISPECIES: DUF4870 domain-containing protein [Mesoflavibacter]|uniref:DUF4870 domain-containing protein n=1 Tax=Mesoflavibacter profundi TaxID=2708110 RepID=A0ABT4RZ55_9FLAO|nr:MULTISPECIES: DUF4870 domain-containing protein [Mesoflavibacter]MDA0177077.1 DUF4870 domain-containing protein [Mesoflavibacter profundi]QIJ87997.1 hypothetical protein C7H62_0187 [Mesoflavibacter sp. HG96]QIJ90725.1 hypothetical protein C7H56_0187 [Mesoflavibacter sp. HG37]